MGHFLLSVAEGEVILRDGSDEEWNGTEHESHVLIFLKCYINLYGVFTVNFYQTATDKIK